MSSDRDSNAAGPVLNSAYYRERFGSRSPEEYKSLRITNIDPKIGGEELREVLEKIFQRYGDMHCKIVRANDVYERIAYVNFEFPEDARDARRKAGPRITSCLGRKTRVDPANVVRDQAGKALRRKSPPPGTFDPYRRSRSRSPAGGGGGGGGGGPDNRFRRDDFEPRGGDNRRQNPGNRGGADPSFNRRRNDEAINFGMPEHPRPTWQYNENDAHEDSFASRTLFVGNLELDISINELRRCFERFGTVEEIDVKTPHQAVTAYAFVRFSDILSAREARKQCSGEYLRDNRCKVGWGKPIITRRLWVGGLGPDASLAWLEKEFDRYGAIEKIDFVRGDNHSYVLFANQEAAVEAWKKLRGIRMKNGILENLIQVDFADASMYDQSSINHHHNNNNNNFDRNGAGDRYRRSLSRSSFNDRNKNTVKKKRSPSMSPAPRRKRMNSGGYSPSFGGESPGVERSTNRRPIRRSPASPGSTRRRNGADKTSRVRGVDQSPGRQTGLAAAAEFASDTLEDLYQIRSPIWTGVLVLKRAAYPLQLYKMAGDDDLVDAYLRNERGESVQLNVTQRLKLDQPRTGEILRVSAAAMQHSAYLLAVPNPNVREDLVGKLADMQSKHLKLLVQYFVDKQAAGVVNTTAAGGSLALHAGAKVPQQGVLYAFPRCTFADDFVATLCPKLTVWQRAGHECLLIVVQKGSTGSASTGPAAANPQQTNTTK